MVETDVWLRDRNYITIFILLMTLAMLVPVYRTVVDIGPGVTHGNHDDTITTPLSGNCGCDYPGCGCPNGQPQLTLMPTEVIPTIPPFGGTVIMPATPQVPHPTTCGPTCATIFPTFELNGLLPTPLSTAYVPTIAPTLIAPDFPSSPIPVGN